ncbi:MAG: DNA-processing protein DprA [Candidatus Aminicenantes bacterium]|nr:DNA-processing protein DprA [Candidatus Aminicenantes bacterium]
MPLFKDAPGPGSSSDRPVSSKIAFLALNLALWDRLASIKKVLARFPDPAEAFHVTAGEWAALGLGFSAAERLSSPGLLDRADKEFDSSKEKGYSLLTLGDVEYPSLLREIFDPPCVLYCIGRTDILERPAVALVGSRRPTPYGRGVAEHLARDLAERGIVMVSGLAVGIDAAGHEGALSGGQTVAVMGSGLDVPYPRTNRKLFDRIAAEGAVISEFPLGTDPLATNFPRRNRIISGLSRALIVVEAAEKSGSLISAGFALEQGREVLAVPGNVTSEVSRGTNGLIKAGAKLVENWMDVAEELPSPFREALLAQQPGETAPLPLLSDAEAAVWGLLSPDVPAHVDELLERTEFSISELLTILLELEIKGVAAEVSGKRYLRRM